jgi:hypothetical protein
VIGKEALLNRHTLNNLRLILPIFPFLSLFIIFFVSTSRAGISTPVFATITPSSGTSDIPTTQLGPYPLTAPIPPAQLRNPAAIAQVTPTPWPGPLGGVQARPPVITLLGLGILIICALSSILIILVVIALVVQVNRSSKQPHP